MCSPECIQALEERIRDSVEKCVLEVLQKYAFKPATSTDEQSKTVVSSNDSNVISNPTDPKSIHCSSSADPPVDVLDPAMIKGSGRKRRKRRNRKTKSSKATQEDEEEEQQQSLVNLNRACSNPSIIESATVNDACLNGSRVTESTQHNLINAAQEHVGRSQTKVNTHEPSSSISGSKVVVANGRTNKFPLCRPPKGTRCLTRFDSSAIHHHHHSPSTIGPFSLPFSSLPVSLFPPVQPSIPISMYNLHPFNAHLTTSASSSTVAPFPPSNGSTLNINRESLYARRSTNRHRSRSRSPVSRHRDRSPAHAEPRRITSARKRPISYRRRSRSSSSPSSSLSSSRSSFSSSASSSSSDRSNRKRSQHRHRTFRRSKSSGKRRRAPSSDSFSRSSRSTSPCHPNLTPTSSNNQIS